MGEGSWVINGGKLFNHATFLNHVVIAATALASSLLASKYGNGSNFHVILHYKAHKNIPRL